MGAHTFEDHLRHRFLQPTPPPTVTSGKRILFLGDSYSVGYGNAGILRTASIYDILTI